MVWHKDKFVQQIVLLKPIVYESVDELVVRIDLTEISFAFGK